MQTPSLLLVSSLGLALAACSGATRPIVDEPPSEGTGSSGGTGTSGQPAGTSSSGGTTGSNGSSGNGTGNGSGNGSGNGNAGSAVDAAAAPDQCPSGAVSQSASGSSESDPVPFDTVACGTIDPGQTYFWTFSLAPSTTKFGVNFSGHVHLEATVKGTTVTVAPGTVLPFDPKDPYELRVTTSESQPEAYVIIVSEQ